MLRSQIEGASADIASQLLHRHRTEKDTRLVITVPSYSVRPTSDYHGRRHLRILGAPTGGAIPNVLEYTSAYKASGVGGVLGAMFTGVGGFRQPCFALLSLRVVANAAGSVYALTLNFQGVLRLVRIRPPRVVYAVALLAVMTPVSIKVAAEFTTSLDDFPGVVCYRLVPSH